MYATCIGLILKGYSDFERRKKELRTPNTDINVPDQFKKVEAAPVEFIPEEAVKPEVMDGRKRTIWDKVKDSIYEIFKEEDDTELR